MKKERRIEDHHISIQDSSFSALEKKRKNSQSILKKIAPHNVSPKRNRIVSKIPPKTTSQKRAAVKNQCQKPTKVEGEKPQVTPAIDVKNQCQKPPKVEVTKPNVTTGGDKNTSKKNKYSLELKRKVVEFNLLQEVGLLLKTSTGKTAGGAPTPPVLTKDQIAARFGIKDGRAINDFMKQFYEGKLDEDLPECGDKNTSKNNKYSLELKRKVVEFNLMQEVGLLLKTSTGKTAGGAPTPPVLTKNQIAARFGIKGGWAINDFMTQFYEGKLDEDLPEVITESVADKSAQPPTCKKRSAPANPAATPKPSSTPSMEMLSALSPAHGTTLEPQSSSGERLKSHSDVNNKLINPNQLRDGMAVWAWSKSDRKKKSNKYWPGRVCDPDGEFVTTKVKPENIEEFMKLKAQNNSKEWQLVYLYTNDGQNMYSYVPKQKIWHFNSPKMLSRFKKLETKMRFTVYHFCREMELDPSNYVGDYVPEGYGPDSEFNSYIVKLQIINQNEGMSYEQFGEVIGLAVGVMREASCLAYNVDSEYISISCLLQLLKSFESLIKFIEGHRDSTLEIYFNISRTIWSRKIIDRKKQLDFNLAICTIHSLLLYFILTTMKKAQCETPSESVKTKICVLRHIACLAERLGKWQANCHKATEKGLQALRGPKRQRLNPFEGALCEKQKSDYEINVCICCGDCGGSVPHMICDGCPSTYRPKCLEKISKEWGISNSNNCTEEERFFNDLWYCPLCYHSFLLYRAVEENDFGKVLDMTEKLKGNFLWINRYAGQYCSPLHVAAFENNSHMLELLLQPIRKGLVEGMKEEKSRFLKTNHTDCFKLPVICLPEDGKGFTPFNKLQKYRCIEAMIAISTCYKDLSRQLKNLPRLCETYEQYLRKDHFWQEEGKGLLSTHWNQSGTETTLEEGDRPIWFGRDMAQGRELDITIPWVNEFDDDKPDDFVYLTRSVFMEGVGPQWGKDQLSRCTKRCQKKVCNTQGTCHERKGLNAEMRNMVECNFLCPCGPGGNPNCFKNYERHGRSEVCNCGNRYSEHGVSSNLSLAVFKTKNKGWGVRTLKPIAKDSFICTYAGEILTSEQCLQREKDYEKQDKPLYIFSLSNCPKDSSALLLDSTNFRNIGGFINHTCSQPNIEWRKIFSDHVDPTLPIVGFYAVRDVSAGEELEYTYDKRNNNRFFEKCHCSKHWTY